MSRRVRRTTMRWASLLVTLAFTASLFTPYVLAQDAAQGAGNVGAMTQTAKSALSDLWFAWVKQGGSSSAKPDRLFAYNFFKTNGANEQQATLLTNNAQAEGQLNSPLPAASSGIGGFFKRMLGIQSNDQTAQAPAAAGSSGLSIGDKIRNFLGGLGGNSSSAASDSRFPMPNNLLPGGGSSTAAVTAQPGAAEHSSAQGAATAAQTADQAAPAAASSGLLGKLKSMFSNVGQKASNATFSIGQGISTALLTAKDKFDIRQFYTIPISDTGSVKITGGSDYTTKFMDGSKVVQQVDGGTNLVDAIKSDEALGRVSQLQTQAGAASVQQGTLGTLASKFSNAIENFKNKITGKPTLDTADQADLSKLQVQANLLEHAQGITAAQQAIQVRIDKINADAARLGQPVDQSQVSDLQKAYDALDAKKTEITKALNGVQESPATSILKQSAQWALYSVGIQAGVNIISQVVSGQKVDFKQALSFIGQPSFWGGTVGGFLGSMILSNVGAALIPGGGIFFRVLPGFLGAALGYKFGAGLFGGDSGTDWIGTIGQTLASAGGYALAYSMLGGASAPGIALIGAGIAAGALFNFIYSKFLGHAQPTSVSMAPTLGNNPLPPGVNNPPTGVPAAGTVAGTPQAAPAGTPANATDSAGLSQAMAAMQSAYTDYINFLKEGKVTDARQAFDRYTQAKDTLDAARASAASSGQ